MRVWNALPSSCGCRFIMQGASGASRWQVQCVASISSGNHPMAPLPQPPFPPACVFQFKEYLDRAEYIKGILDGQQPAEEAPSGQNGAAAAKGRGGAGGGGGDSKQVCCTVCEWGALQSVSLMLPGKADKQAPLLASRAQGCWQAAPALPTHLPKSPPPHSLSCLAPPFSPPTGGAGQVEELPGQRNPGGEAQREVGRCGGSRGGQRRA